MSGTWQRGCLTNRALWPILLKIPFSFFFFPLRTVGTCGKQTLWAEETFKGLPVPGAKYKQTCPSPVSRFLPLLLSVRLPVLTTGIGSLSRLGTLVSGGRKWRLEVSLFLSLRISDPAGSKYCFFWSLVPECYNPAPWLPARTSQGRVEGGCLSDVLCRLL